MYVLWMYSKWAKFCMNDVFENTWISKYRNDFLVKIGAPNFAYNFVKKSNTYIPFL